MTMVGLTLILVGFSLFAGLIPSVTGNYSDQRFVLCVVSWLVVCHCLARAVFSGHKTTNTELLPWLLPFVLVLLSGEIYPAIYHVEPLMFAFFFVGLCLLGSQLSQTESLELITARVLSAIAFLALIYGFIALMNYGLALRDGNRAIDTTITWGFPNIRYWGHLATWLIPLIAAAQRSGALSALPLVRMLFMIAGALWWWMLFSTSARGSAIALFVGFSFVAVMFRGSAFGLLRSGGTQLLAGGLLWMLLTFLVPWFLFGAVELREVDVDSSGRMPLWREAWEMSLVNMPFGLGPLSWLTHPVISDVYANSKSYGHPHNMYLLWAAEYGWISIMALAIAVVGIGRALVARGSKHRASGLDATLMAGFTLSVVAASVHAGVSAVFMAPASMLTGFLVFTLFLALLQASPLNTVAPRRASATPLIRFSAGLVLVLSLVAGGWWLSEVWRYYQDNMDDRLTYKGDGAIYSPRFWSHGDFPRQLNMD